MALQEQWQHQSFPVWNFSLYSQHLYFFIQQDLKETLKPIGLPEGTLLFL